MIFVPSSGNQAIRLNFTLISLADFFGRLFATAEIFVTATTPVLSTDFSVCGWRMSQGAVFQSESQNLVKRTAVRPLNNAMLIPTMTRSQSHSRFGRARIRTWIGWVGCLAFFFPNRRD